MSQAGTVPKRLSTTSWKQCRTIAQRLYISDAKEFGEIPMPSPRTGVPKTGELDQNRRFSTGISLYRRNAAR